LASPFTAWNFAAGQSGFLTAFLLGTGSFYLERNPVIAGVFIGCLTYKPQFGILFPVALLAGRRWEALTSAAITTLLLAGASIVFFGMRSWIAFPQSLAAQSAFNLSGGPESHWGLLQSVYGFIRYSGGSTSLAWTGQGIATLGVGLCTYLTWKHNVSYSIRAATLATGALIATPYVHAPDMAALAIPVAFFARERLQTGWRSGEQTLILALFVASLSILPAAGRSLIGAPILIALLGLILRRAFSCAAETVAPMATR
jgi:arabinofuranan 3-O-arabinosyltransferase